MDTLAYEMMKNEVNGKIDRGLARKYSIAKTMFVAVARAYYGNYDKEIEELLSQFESDEAVQTELQDYLANARIKGQISTDEWNTKFAK